MTDICARLKGIPLGIDLAAARVRLLSVGDIATRNVRGVREALGEEAFLIAWRAGRDADVVDLLATT